MSLPLSILRKLTLLGVLAITCSGQSLAQRMSAADCAAEADRAARDQRSVLGGAARGAAKGAVFGAIVGNRDSARRGAAVAGVVGGARAAGRKNDVYERVYDDCMRGVHYRY